MVRILFLIFVLYLAYKIIFDFIIPISRASSSVKSKIKQMQEEQLRQQQSNTAAQKNTAKNIRTDSEYIDFEEVK